MLAQILATDRSKFHIECYGGITHEHIRMYDSSLFCKVAHRTLNQGSHKDSQLDELSFLIASTLFQFVAALSIPEINLHFAITSDIGNLNIVLKHTLIDDIEFKVKMSQENWTEEQIMTQFGKRYKLNIAKPIQIAVFSKE